MNDYTYYSILVKLVFWENYMLLIAENQVLQILHDAKSIQLNMAKIMCQQILHDAGSIKICARTHFHMTMM